jgi:TRAP-type mannitol/chloroaromatic compound transport system permease small subunit
MVVCASALVLSGGYITMRRAHIAITVVYDHTKGKVRWSLDLFILVVSISAMFIFAYSLWEPMVHAISGLERSGTSFNSPEPLILKTLLFVSAMMYGIQLIVNLIKLLTGHGVEIHDSQSEN